MLQSVERKKVDIKRAIKDGDDESITRLQAEIDTDLDNLDKFTQSRRSEANGAVGLGVVSTIGADRDVHTDIVTA
ncbi:MAG: hypothetical protein ACC656_06680, partial [Candidatus Heimdallarchaeota archaeon]